MTTTVVVCDASPLIFLAKLDRLDLIREILSERIVVLQCVADEIKSDRADPVETARLDAFLQCVEVVDFEAGEPSSRTLSRCDQATLTWATENRADWLLADERLLRRVAAAEGIPVIGFIGLLVAAAQRCVIEPEEARGAIDAAVSQHGCRISIALYRRVLEELDRIGGSG